MSVPEPDEYAEREEDDDSWSIGEIQSELSFSAIAPNFLVKLAEKPQQTILGVLGTIIIGGILDLWQIVLDGLTLIAWGDEIASTEGQLGVVDIPVRIVELTIGGFDPIGDALLLPLKGLYDLTGDLVASSGLAAWPLGVAIVVGAIVLVERTLRRTGRATLAAIPIIGPFLEALLR